MSATASLERYRPGIILVIATFLFAATIIAFITGESLLFPNALLDRMWKFNPQGAALFHSIGRVSGVFLLALGVGTFFAALGLLRGQRWAWWFGVFSIQHSFAFGSEPPEDQHDFGSDRIDHLANFMILQKQVNELGNFNTVDCYWRFSPWSDYDV
jgi:hypothetical protein